MSPISEWVRAHAERVKRPGAVLDLAAGSGRHARFFKDLGYKVTALDRDIARMADLIGQADIEILAADLEDGSPWPLGDRRFAGIVVTNYLHRPLLPRLVEALETGGVLIYETFSAGNERFGKPDNPKFLLQPGELLRLAEAEGLTVLGYCCGEVIQPPAVRQALAARRSR